MTKNNTIITSIGLLFASGVIVSITIIANLSNQATANSDTQHGSPYEDTLNGDKNALDAKTDLSASTLDSFGFAITKEGKKRPMNNAECCLGSKELVTRRMIENAAEPISLIEELTYSKDRSRCYEIALLAWFDHDPVSLSQWIADQPYNEDIAPVLPTLIELSISNPENAIHYASKILSRSLRNEYLNTLIALWLETDPTGTIYWSLETQQEGNKWLALAFDTLSKQSIPEAVTSLTLLKSASAEQVNISIQSIINHSDKDNINANTLLIIEALEPYVIREQLIKDLLPVLISNDNITLEDLDDLQRNLLPGELKNTIQHDIAYHWMSKHPEEAAQYIESIEEDHVRTQSINTLVSYWVQTDPEATSTWVSTLNDDINISAVTLGNAFADRGNIQMAQLWFNKIDNEPIRTKAIYDVISFWFELDPVASVHNLVAQELLSKQQKLDMLLQLYPNQEFTDPNEILDNLEQLAAE